MDIDCRRCGHRIPAADVNLEQLVAKCSQCNAVFPFTDQLQTKPAPLVRAPVALPEGWEMDEGQASPFGQTGYRSSAASEPRRLTLRWRWFSAHHVFMLVFALFWCGFLVFWYTGAAAAGAPLFFLLFPIIHVAVGVGLLYASLAGLFNRTTLRIENGELSIAHHPLPWRGARTLPASEIRQLYCVEVHKRTKNGHSIRYSVKAQRNQGDEIDLVKNLQQSNQALFIERKVEDALGIEDVPIVGELNK